MATRLLASARRPGSPDEWHASTAAFEQDLAAIVAILSNEQTNLLTPVPGNPEHTLLREALIVADHNAYHLSGVTCHPRATSE